jgi:hypothetical protein
VGTRRPPFPTPPGSISHRLIAILPDSFEVRSTGGCPVRISEIVLASLFEAESSGALIHRRSTVHRGGGGRLVSGLLCIALLLVVHVLLVYISLLGDGD